MPSIRGATQTAAFLLLTCAGAACSLDLSGLDPDAGPPSGRIDVSHDVQGLDAGGAVVPDLASDGADSSGSGDGGIGNADSGIGNADSADSGDAGAVDLPAMLDGGADASDVGGTPDAVEVEVGPAAIVVGCADRTREGLIDLAAYPIIAACDGGWQVPGLLSGASRAPACARGGGNDGAQPDGLGCSAADLCAAGWHVCESAAEVTNRGGDCVGALLPSNGRKVFYATRQTGDDNCGDNGNSGPGRGPDNLVHGCGNFAVAPSNSCAPLNGVMHDDDCTANFPWRCAVANRNEITVVTKPGPSLGGVLCCKD